MGRFTSVDKLADHPNQVDKSPFAYAWDNPIKLTDPDGNCPNCRELFLALDQALTGGKIGRALETGLGFVPIVGQILDASAAATGEELFTGEQLSGGERALALVPGKIEKLAGAASGIVKNADEIADVSKSARVQKYEVGEFNDLKRRSEVGDGLDLHHVPQKHPANQVIEGYDSKTGTAIAIPQGDHRTIRNQKGSYKGTPRDLLARGARDLRNAGVPNQRVQEVIQRNRKKYPESFEKK